MQDFHPLKCGLLIKRENLLKLKIILEDNTENTLKDTAFCHLQENLVMNMVKH